MDGQGMSLQEWFTGLSLAQQRGIFWGLLLGISGALIVFLTRARAERSQSFFQVREHERERVGTPRSASFKHSRPLLLEGARLDAPAHELLGVRSQATVEEIQKAYRAQMLRYHPDRIGQSGGVSPQTQAAAAQIARALTQARDSMLAQARARR